MKSSKWIKSLLTGVACLCLLNANSALAWGDSGHRMIGEEAMRALPDYMPGFLHSAQAISDVGE